MSPLLVETPPLPALVVGETRHARRAPVEHVFTTSHHQYLVDLDAPPPWPRWVRPLASVRPEDHLAGAPSFAALKGNVLRVLGREGIDPTPVTRVVMLAHARVLGYAFDPMTAFWCLDDRGAVHGVVIEVHNTYGERHAYAIVPDHKGYARVDKAFYVSPFHDVSGYYEIRLRLDPRWCSVGITLRDGGPDLDGTAFTATVSGRCEPATPRAVARQSVRSPFITQRVSGLIRGHGIALWLRRLPVQTRPEHTKESVR